MTVRSVFSLCLVLITTLAISACSRQTIYENAIDWERSGAGLKASTLTLDDMTIAYLMNEEKVDGDTIVMVHGFGANKDNWTRLAKELSEEFNIYAIDLPGHGDSSKPLDIEYHLDDQTRYLARILEKLDLGKVHMMGNSMGGAITALYAAANPEQIQSAVLLAPAGIHVYESDLAELVKAGDNPLIPSKEGDFKRLIDFALVKKPFAPWPVYDVMEEKAIANQEVNQAIFDDLVASGSEVDFRGAIKTIKAPVLIIWGVEDRITDARNADIFAQDIATTRKVLLDDVGHAPMIEVPEESAQLFREFLAEVVKTR